MTDEHVVPITIIGGLVESVRRDLEFWQNQYASLTANPDHDPAEVKRAADVVRGAIGLYNRLLTTAQNVIDNYDDIHREVLVEARAHGFLGDDPAFPGNYL